MLVYVTRFVYERRTIGKCAGSPGGKPPRAFFMRGASSLSPLTRGEGKELAAHSSTQTAPDTRRPRWPQPMRRPSTTIGAASTISRGRNSCGFMRAASGSPASSRIAAPARRWPASTICIAMPSAAPRSGRASPISRRSSASRKLSRGIICARWLIRCATPAPAATRPNCASTIPTAARCASTAPTIRTRCAASISTAWCSTNTPTWTRASGRRSSGRRSRIGRAGPCSSARRAGATIFSRCGGARSRRPAGSR